MKLRTLFFFMTVMGLAWQVQAQPAGIPSGGNVPCSSDPGTDTVVSTPDSEGFYSIFNGTDFTGWWESCQSSHSRPDATNGGIWIVDQNIKAIFSQQTTGGAGSILMTNKTYDNYELVFDFWPDFGNDAGIFNRTSADGRCYQTVLDYINGGSVGGVWGEGGYASLDIRPYSMGGNENSINKNSWSYGGSWASAWDVDGWNQIRIEVFGNPPRVRTYQRILGEEEWIPVLDHTSSVANQPSGYIGIQIHQGTGRWSGREGNWYKDIKLRPLTPDGEPKRPISGCTDPKASNHNADAAADNGSCTYSGCGDANASNDFCLANAEAYPCMETNGYTRANITGVECIVGIVPNEFSLGKDVQFHKTEMSVSITQSIGHQIQLLDVKGDVKYESRSSNAETYAFDHLNLKSGVYMLQVITAQGEAVKKYVKQ